GCGDDEGDGDNDMSSDMIDMTPDGDMTECCTEAECQLNGQTCNMTSCMCEDVSAVCTAAGSACDPTVAQDPGFVCVDDTMGGGGCAVACSATSPCAMGSVCIDGACVEGDCTHFFTDDCAAGETCNPIGNGAWACFTDGMVAEGGTCINAAGMAVGDCAEGT